MDYLKIGLTLTFLSIVTTGTVEAHPGRTDANGGHTCRTNCEKWGLQYGEYHYHNGGSAPIVDKAPVVIQQIAPTKTPVRVPTKAPVKKPQIVNLATKPVYTETEMDKKKLFKVVKVLDGDTIEVNVRGKIEKVRLLAINSPEIANPKASPQCFAKEARTNLSSLISGKYVKLIDDRKEGNKDKHQRLLRYVYLEDTFINAEMVKQGSAVAYREYPTKYFTELLAYENEARNNKLGLWKACK